MDFKEYFRNKSLVKNVRAGIYFEQKTTPDLLWCVTHVILNIIKNAPDRVFTDKEIRESDIFNDLMRDYFSKAPQELAENEYNKVSSYQLDLLSFAGVLEQVSIRPKTYKAINIDVLQYIAVNDFNASKFLAEYTEKFIVDNGFKAVFDIYKSNPNQDNYERAKEAYWEWAQRNTAIRGSDRRHTYRVFNKLFNVFCYKNRLPGENRSRVITGPCPYSFLIYNRTNFRDMEMPTGMSRAQYRNDILENIEQVGIVETLLGKVKEAVRERHGNDSEIKDVHLGYTPNAGVHVHHIFPSHSYPQFSLSRENLIVLNPGQHLSLAHIKANTTKINRDFQIICLKQKLKDIEESVRSNDGFYNQNELINMVNTAFGLSISQDSSITEISVSLTGLNVNSTS